jgi:Helix-turn-helix domain
MSWKALDWATDIRVGSPTMRLILILPANKADEKFSCYPSVGTLVTESCAARSTVLETLKRLEVEGFITRVAQYHESGAQRSSRYLLNHPDAPHLKPGPESGPLEPSRRTTIRTVANDPAAIDARTLATQWRGGHGALTSSRVRAGFGMDLANPQSSSVTKTGRSPLPCRSPCTAPRGVTHAAESLAPAQDTLVRRVRRRAIPDHHRHTPGRNRGGGILPPLQSTEAATAGRPEDSEYRRKVNQLQTNVFDQLPLLLAVPRAAAILGISRAAAYRLAASGECPVRRLGGRVYVVTAELRELVAS